MQRSLEDIIKKSIKILLRILFYIFIILIIWGMFQDNKKEINIKTGGNGSCKAFNSTKTQECIVCENYHKKYAQNKNGGVSTSYLTNKGGKGNAINKETNGVKTGILNEEDEDQVNKVKKDDYKTESYEEKDDLEEDLESYMKTLKIIAIFLCVIFFSIEILLVVLIYFLFKKIGINRNR